MSGAIAFWSDCALTQITPDNTLGTESSTITPNVNIQNTPSVLIDGGAQRGANLFHSFQQFNIDEGRGAYFTNPNGINHIFSRVTGGSPSNLLGTLGVLGSANLFLINPNGIIFGPNASLNVGGSFVATTADAIGFGNQGFFSASNPESSSSVLTVNPSALLFNQLKTASIQNNSVFGLRVPDSKSLLLVGGDINMNGGALLAFGGRVELGGISGKGAVALNSNGNNLSLSFPNSIERSDVFLSNGAGVAVIADGGGSIAINARNLEMTGQSQLVAGIEPGLDSDNSQAGNIEVNTTGAINLNNSLIVNLVRPKATGNGGDIYLRANTLQVENGAEVSANTSGVGNGGSLTVDAQQVQVNGSGSQFFTGLSAYTQSGSTGDAGDLAIKTNTLIVQNGGLVDTSTFGMGRGGNLTIDAIDVQVIGQGSGLLGFAQSDPTGNAGSLSINTNTLTVKDGGFIRSDTLNARRGGNLTIKTNTLLVEDGSLITASTFGSGNGGNLNIDAKDIQLVGIDSALFASAQPGSTGNAGSLSIKTNTLVVRDGAEVVTDTSGTGKGGNLNIDAQDLQLIGIPQFFTGLSASSQPDSTGDAGNLTIKTNTLTVRNGAQVNANSFGKGNGGNLTVAASQSINLSGRRSLLSSQTQGSGASGNLQISTRQLTVQDGAQISTSSFAEGQGGNLFVNASETIELIGTSPDNDQIPSGLFAQGEGAGASGNLEIVSGRFIVRDGAGVSTTTYGQGQGGRLSVNASDSVELTGGGGLSTQAQGDGVAGNLAITTRKLIVRDGSQVLTTTYGQGQGGILSVNASDSVELTGRLSGLFADTQGDGAAGSLTINTNKLIVQDEAQISTGTVGKGQGGNLTVNAADSVLISSSANSSRFSGLLSLAQGEGAAGNLNITTEQLTLKDKAQIAVASEGTGQAGNLDVTARSIFLDGNQAGINAQTAVGNGGNITLQDLDLLLLRRGSQISTNAGTEQQPGNGGNIAITAPNGFIIAVPNENSDITANAYTGKGGRVDIEAFGIYGIQPRQNPTSLSDITASSEFGIQGTIELNTPEIDPNSGLVELPSVPVDTEIAQGCTAGGTVAKSEFTITGRGGLPTNPGEALSTDAVQVDLVTLNPQIAVSSTPNSIVEAENWVIDANGNVTLIANVRPNAGCQN